MAKSSSGRRRAQRLLNAIPSVGAAERVERVRRDNDGWLLSKKVRKAEGWKASVVGIERTRRDNDPDRDIQPWIEISAIPVASGTAEAAYSPTTSEQVLTWRPDSPFMVQEITIFKSDEGRLTMLLHGASGVTIEVGKRWR